MSDKSKYEGIESIRWWIDPPVPPEDAARFKEVWDETVKAMGVPIVGKAILASTVDEMKPSEGFTAEWKKRVEDQISGWPAGVEEMEVKPIDEEE